MTYISKAIRNRVQRNKITSLGLTAMMICWPALAITGCNGGGFLGLEDYQRDLIFGVGSLATGLLNEGQPGPQGPTGPAGPPGEPSEANPIPGADGLNCWDLNQNGQPDPEEDVNGDGVVDTSDCRGVDGEDGFDGADAEDGAAGPTGPSGFSGQTGPPGSSGQAGEAGADGKSCWDLNENGSGDITEGEDNEDINHDGFVNVLDCRGADGVNGVDGVDGTSGSDGAAGSAGANGTNGTNGVDGIDGDNCWDLNGNGVGDITEGDDNEDVNGDQVVNGLDCRGTDGIDGLHGTDGLSGTAGRDGADGMNCWDLNANRIGDITPGEDNEDRNHDGFVNVLDCIGTDGKDGVAGANGTNGTNGSNGTNGIDGVAGLAGDNCWDLNGNGVGDITTGDDNEDVNGDQVVNVLDCRGLDGADGVNGTTGTNGTNGANGANGVDGLDGAVGMHCWDLNGNGSRDITDGEDNEDVNGDRVVDALDCRGVDGRDGRDGADGLGGANGTNGTNGVDGLDGADGIHCWDLNGNGLGDITTGLDNEDINGDQVVDMQDCRGSDGLDGQDGIDGRNGVDGQDGADGRDGVDGVAGRDGVDGRDGAPGPMLFDTYIDEFVTVEGGSYGSIPLTADGLPIVDIEEPAIGACGGYGVDVVAYRMAVPVRYTPGNPITMRMFIWRTGPRNENCFAMRLDAFRASHGSGIGQYGFARFITLDDPADPDPVGTLLVVDLPLNNMTGDLADGLGFANDLTPGTLLAFELNSIPGFDDGGCYSMAGVEFYESTLDESVAVTHATVSPTPPAGGCGSFVDCNENGIPDDAELGIEGHINPVGVMICHIPPGNPDLAHTITVAEAAVDAHLAHGDRLGSCTRDCNENAIPDECEIDLNSLAEGGPYFCSPECVGCPEVCDADENSNGVPDVCDQSGELDDDDDHDHGKNDDHDHHDDHDDHGDSQDDS